MKKPRIAAVLVLVVVGVIAYILWGQYQRERQEHLIEGSGTIETTEVEVGSLVGGRIARVVVNEGDNVQKGQVLVTLEPYQLPAQKAELQAQLTQAQAQLDELIRGPRSQEIAAARAQYREAAARASLMAAGAREEEITRATASRRQAEADLNRAKADFQRLQTLFDRKVISAQELDTARNAYEVAQERLVAAQQQEQELRRGNRPQEIAAAQQQAKAQLEQLRLLEAGTRPEEIEAQRGRIAAIEAQIQQLNATQDELQVVSPCHCQVSSMNLKPGQLILASQTLATLVNLNDLWVRVYIPEELFGRIQMGDPATARVDAFPKKRFTGKVVQIASRAEFTPRNVQTEESRKIQVFGIKVALDNTEGLLRPGMPADVAFEIDMK